MKFSSAIVVVLGAALSMAQAPVASHAPTLTKAVAPPSVSGTSMQVTGKLVARVNDAVLTDRDLLREMFAIFPYARVHNGFPKAQEASIRKGALEMLEFEELVYQEAERRKMTIPPERLKRAEAAYRERFSNNEEFQQYLNVEMNGSMQQFRKTVRRSLLIDALLKSELDVPSRVTLADARAYYQNNPKRFTHEEQIQFQTISIMPDEKASNEVKEQARKRAEEALRQAQATHSYEEFGILAEKLSEDDYRVNMGDHKSVERGTLPPEALPVLDKLKPGEVSGICRFGSFYAIFRLQARRPAGKVTFEQVRARLLEDLHKERYNSLRSALDKKLRTKATVEEL